MCLESEHTRERDRDFLGTRKHRLNIHSTCEATHHVHISSNNIWIWEFLHLKNTMRIDNIIMQDILLTNKLLFMISIYEYITLSIYIYIYISVHIYIDNIIMQEILLMNNYLLYQHHPWCMQYDPLTCARNHSHVTQLMYVTHLIIYVTQLSHMCDMTHSYVWHASFIYVIQLIHINDRTHSYMWHNSCI